MSAEWDEVAAECAVLPARKRKALAELSVVADGHSAAHAAGEDGCSASAAEVEGGAMEWPDPSVAAGLDASGHPVQPMFSEPGAGGVDRKVDNGAEASSPEDAHPIPSLATDPLKPAAAVNAPGFP